MNTKISKPDRLFNDHTRLFNLIKDDLEKYYENYSNKRKILALLDYWLFSVITIFEIYGHDALVRYEASNIKSPLRFSYFEQYQTSEDLILPRVKTDLSIYFFRIIKKIILPGADIKKISDKVISRLTKKFVSIELIEVLSEEKEAFLDLISEYFEKNSLYLRRDFIESIIPPVFLSNEIKTRSRSNLIAEGTAHAFMDLVGYEKILLLDRKIIMHGSQHGGGYDMFAGDHYSDFEKNLCDTFIGWGLSESNYGQSKFIQDRLKKEEKKCRIVWVERAKYPNFLKTMNYGQYLQFTNIEILKFIKGEMNKGKHEYYNMPHPSNNRSDDYEGFRGKTLSKKNRKGEDLIGKNDIVVFDNTASTLMHFCIANNILFILVVPEISVPHLSKKALNWFHLLREQKFIFYENEVGKLSTRIEEIMQSPIDSISDLSQINQRFFL